MRVGKQMQFFGARCNLPKLLLLALNGGYDQTSGTAIWDPRWSLWREKYLDYDDVMERLAGLPAMAVCRLYVNTMNVIHYMHDKYAYEKTQMALHDTDVEPVYGLWRGGSFGDGRLPFRHQIRQGQRAIRDDNGYHGWL